MYGKRYGDFGPAFAAEKPEEEGIRISDETLRRRLIEEGLREGRRRRPACFGEPVPFDGSHHDWFESRGLRYRLVTMIGDASKTRLSQFFEEETTRER
jgi:hypothetical protein